MTVTQTKVWRDLVCNKARTLLVVLATAVGIFALGLVFGLSGTIRTRLSEDHRASQPGHIALWIRRSTGLEVVEAARYEPGVVDAEATMSSSVRWRLEGETEWRDGSLRAQDSYETQRMNLIDLLDGSWPEVGTLAVERQSAAYTGISPGTTILVDTGRRELRLPVEGVVRDPQVAPPQFGGNATFYAVPQTFARITGQGDFDTLHVRMDDFTTEGANDLAERLEGRLERMGVEVGGRRITDPEAHSMQEAIDAILLIMAAMGGLSLALGAFLIINTINALVAQQVWQIGVMKAVGATAGHVIRHYLTTALIYGGTAVCVATPLSAVAAHLLARWLLDMFNVPVAAYRSNPSSIAIQTAVGLGVPLMAAFAPVVGGARISVREAISSYGLGGSFGRSILDRLVGRIRFLPRPLALSLRNTFRHKSRVALTLLTLVMSGVLFIVVMSVGDSLSYSVEMLINDFGLDVLVALQRPYRTAVLESVTSGIPGVERAEVWEVRIAALELEDGGSIQGQLWGVPANSRVFNPRIVSGRGLLPEDGYAILLNQKIAADEGIALGDTVTLNIAGRESTWTVVGLVFNLNNRQRDNFVPFETLVREMGIPNRGSFVMVQADTHDAERQRELIGELRDVYTTRNIKVDMFESSVELRERTRSQFRVVILLLLAMAGLAAVVGSLGLASTMSINVVERGREIGVMRAIGARSRDVAAVFVSEGVILGLISWLLALPISYPGALVLSQAVGEALFGARADFSYSIGGVVLWLGIVSTLAGLASLVPALRATRISVRDSLTYE
jgi:putative ABC transport system permease protein